MTIDELVSLWALSPVRRGLSRPTALFLDYQALYFLFAVRFRPVQ